jgi:uncharacterized YigZ family protein
VSGGAGAGRGGYRAPAAEARGELREKGSRFLAVVAPAADEEAARAVVEALRREHPDATHHCFAWRLGAEARERSSDAGEPGGTAGPPILSALRGAGLSDVVAVVVRWFGGVKLGKGGLVRAYGGAARAALGVVATVERTPVAELALTVPYPALGAVKRLVHPPEVELAEEVCGPDSARLRLAVHEARRPDLEEALAALGLAPDPARDARPPRLPVT